MARCVLDPRTNQWVAWWDLVTTLALLFTALVTPVEVAFLQAPNNWAERLASPLFWTNRCIDVIFIADMILQFFLAYKTEDVREGTRWIVEPKKIAWHYLCSFWFPLDLFCVLTLLFDVLGDEGTKDLQGLRAVRTLRLAKLVKLARGSRILKRWEMHFSINYSMLGLTNVTITILISWKNGKAFRGRLVPIYAKHIKRSIIMEKRVAEGSPTMVSINSSRITRRLSEAMVPTAASITAATNEEGGEKTPNGAPPKSPFRRMLGGSSTPKTPKTPKKNQASSCSSIAQAAAQNFGLHMREQDLKAALKDEKVQKTQMAQLYKDVGQLQNDMNTVLKILKATHPELAHLDAKPAVVAEPLKDIGSKTPRDVELNRAPVSTEVDEEVEPIPGSACSKRASTSSRRHSALEGKALQRARSGLSPTSTFTARSSEGVPVVVTATAVASTSSSASPDDLQVQVPPP